MLLIAHRGNTNGRFESWENEPTYIDKAINEGFDVEIDVWFVGGILYLGHDKPDYGVDTRWLIERSDKLWIVVPAEMAYGAKGYLDFVKPNEKLFYDIFVMEVY